MSSVMLKPEWRNSWRVGVSGRTIVTWVDDDDAYGRLNKNYNGNGDDDGEYDDNDNVDNDDDDDQCHEDVDDDDGYNNDSHKKRLGRVLCCYFILKIPKLQPPTPATQRNGGAIGLTI